MNRDKATLVVVLIIALVVSLWGIFKERIKPWHGETCQNKGKDSEKEKNPENAVSIGDKIGKKVKHSSDSPPTDMS